MGLRTWLGLKKKRSPAVLRAPRTWTELAHLRFTRKLSDVPVLTKLDMAEVARACGLRTPNLLRQFDDPRSIDLSGLPEAFVVKPIALAARRGVLILSRAEDCRTYWEALRKKHMTLEEIREEEIRWQDRWNQKRNGHPFHIVVEEMIVGENGRGNIPFDYKLYTFGGEVRFILQIDRNVSPPALAFFVGEFEPFDYATRLINPWKDTAPGSPILPCCHRELVDAAKKIAVHMRASFLSVDTYAGADGPVVGELTPTPGAPYYGMFRFRPDFDAELGHYWIQALQKYGIDIPEIKDRAEFRRRRPALPREIA